MLGKSFLKVTGLAVSLVLMQSGLATADVVELEPAKDNTIWEDDAGGLSSGSGSLFSGRTGQSRTTRALIAFDLTAIPPGSAINSVQLRLQQSNSQNNNPSNASISVYRVSQDWGEGTSNGSRGGGGGAAPTPSDATWLHTFFDGQFWNTPGGDFESTRSATLPVGGNGSYAWPSTEQFVADVQDMVDQPSGNFGWIIRGNESTARTAKRFNSREDASGRPTLIVDFTTPVLLPPPAFVFAQFANGEVIVDQPGFLGAASIAGILNRTRIILRNNSDQSATGEIRFRGSMPGQAAAPVSLPINGEQVSVVPFDLPGWGTLDVQTDGTGELVTGVVEVFSLSGDATSLEGTEVFDLLGGFVSVGASETLLVAQAYVSRNAAENSGLAIYNPDPDTAATVQILLLDSMGVQQATAELTLQPNQHSAVFVDDPLLFQEFFQENPEDFNGTLNLNVIAGDGIAVESLLQRLPGGELIAVRPSPNAFTQTPQE